MKKLGVFALAAALALGCWFAWRSGLIGRLSDYDELVQTMRGGGARGPLICIAVQFLQVVIFVIPGEITQLAAGYVFGSWLGFLYSLIGIMLGSAFNYSFARIVGRPVMEKIIGPERLSRLDHLLTSSKGKSAMFMLFLAPGLPKDAMSYGAGLTSIGFGEFVVISGLGRSPALIASTFIGGSLYEGDYGSIAAVVAIVLAAGAAFYLFEKKRRRR